MVKRKEKITEIMFYCGLISSIAGTAGTVLNLVMMTIKMSTPAIVDKGFKIPPIETGVSGWLPAHVTLVITGVGLLLILIALVANVTVLPTAVARIQRIVGISKEENK